MAENTIKKIQAIEEKAAGIVESARQAAATHMRKTRENHEKELKIAQETAVKEEENLMQSSMEQAEKEAQKTEADNRHEIELLKKSTAPKIPAAKKEILQCL